MYIKLGKDATTGHPYYIDPMRHICIVGATGVGKSSLSEHIFTGFVRQGYGGLAFDVHGDLVDRLARILPSSRMRRNFIYYDPTLDSVPVFNPLFFSDPNQLELAKETVISLLKTLSGSDEATRASAMGNETPHRARIALDAICEHVKDPTIVHFARYVLDPDFQAKTNGKSSNVLTRLFVRLFTKLLGHEQAAKFAPLTNKVSRLLRPAILPSIGSAQSLDPLDVMDGGHIMICRLSKGRLGAEPAMILYSLIISMFTIAAMRRESQEYRHPFIILADEAQNGVHGGMFGTLLAEARKYAISLITAFQSASQMPIIDDILTNAGTQIVFNCSGRDAKLFAENWRTTIHGSMAEIEPHHFTELSRYEFIARTFENNQPIVRQIKALPPVKAHRPSADRFIAQSLQRWARGKAATMEEVKTALTA